MPQVTNGMQAWGVKWRKSSYSNPSGNCVEVAELAGGLIAVRDSWDPDGPVQVVTRVTMAAFVRSAKADEFGQQAG